jgi:hypothetical protein
MPPPSEFGQNKTFIRHVVSNSVSTSPHTEDQPGFYSLPDSVPSSAIEELRSTLAPEIPRLDINIFFSRALTCSSALSQEMSYQILSGFNRLSPDSYQAIVSALINDNRTINLAWILSSQDTRALLTEEQLSKLGITEHILSTPQTGVQFQRHPPGARYVCGQGEEITRTTWTAGRFIDVKGLRVKFDGKSTTVTIGPYVTTNGILPSGLFLMPTGQTYQTARAQFNLGIEVYNRDEAEFAIMRTFHDFDTIAAIDGKIRAGLIQQTTGEAGKIIKEEY